MDAPLARGLIPDGDEDKAGGARVKFPDPGRADPEESKSGQGAGEGGNEVRGGHDLDCEFCQGHGIALSVAPNEDHDYNEPPCV